MQNRNHIEHPLNSVIDNIVQDLRPRIKRRGRRKNNSAHFGDTGYVAQVSKIERGRAREQHETPPLLQDHIGGAADQADDARCVSQAPEARSRSIRRTPYTESLAPVTATIRRGFDADEFMRSSSPLSHRAP
jgi:hypothetical protein